MAQSEGQDEVHRKDKKMEVEVMGYVYRNGVEYLIKYASDTHGKPIIAKPQKFGRLKRRD